jgi:toxin secretion/phage lysis holin
MFILMPDNAGLFIKAAVSSLLAAAAARLGALGDLLWLFIAALALDYITGVVSAAYRRELDSGTGFKGLLKKLGKIIVVACALICDEVVTQGAASLGASMFSTGGAIACVVTIWLILNELISILENLAGMDIALPPFLLKAVRLLKHQNETRAESGIKD